MTVPSIDDAAGVLADPSAYTDESRLHSALTHLRTTAPVSLVESPKYRPFWAITKHEDIMAISRNNSLFTNFPRPVLIKAVQEEMDIASQVKTLIHMDDPEHKVVRAIAGDWFRPKAMKAMKARVSELATTYVDKMRAMDGDYDFVQQIAVNYPLYVIMSLLGVPESDFPLMLKLTQELLGSEEPEYHRGANQEDRTMALLEMFEYFNAVTASRREHPTDDLASTIANATIDGEPLSDIETVSYYLIIATAGHDTTSATIAGGMQALIENPGERARLVSDPGLITSAAEEMIRWTTPVKAFMRTAAQDTEVRGVPVAQGESLLLSYVSGNRDEDIFDDPFRFDVGRSPNNHVAFGYGVHFCLGAALARMEVSSFYSELLPRLESVELAGEPELIATTFVGGLKHLPVRAAVV
ncbi:cytochrome P450 [Williamsia sp.]|uniref:cytochrome P450 n=1 Tax=Williamsia sp. TaxID=1872085 RepID=UPI002F92E973